MYYVLPLLMSLLLPLSLRSTIMPSLIDCIPDITIVDSGSFIIILCIERQLRSVPHLTIIFIDARHRRPLSVFRFQLFLPSPLTILL